MKRLFFITVISIWIVILTPFSLVNAFNFDPANIITDFELKDKNSMSQNAIQAFLNKHNSVLKDLIFDASGTQKTAAEIIYQAAQQHIISPKFILTKLDQEQCLIRGCSFLKNSQKLQKALDWACGFSVCDSCKGSGNDKYRGFANQVDAVASVQNDYIRKAGTVSYIRAKGRAFTTNDDYTIIPENQATANLYTYTPYQGGDNGVGGNYLFAKLWDQFWGNLLYPDGTVLKDEKGGYWLIDGSVKRRYATDAAYLSSHSPDDAITVSAAVLDEYEDGFQIKFANYSLVQDEKKDTYLLVDGRKRKIQDQETFRALGFNPEEVETVISQEIAAYKNAVPITPSSIYPQGTLLLDAEANHLYWAQNGFKHSVHSNIVDLNYPNVQPMTVSKQEIDKLYLGNPKKIKDGKFVKSAQGQIYLISQEMLRPIASVVDFISLFGEAKLSHIKEVSDDVLSLHKIGDALSASDYERDSVSQDAVKTGQKIDYKALWISADVPAAIIAGKSYHAKIIFKNKNGENWPLQNIYLKLEQTAEQVLNQDIVLSGGNYTFDLPFVLSKPAGETDLTFKLYAKEGKYIPGGFYQIKAKIIDPIYKAEIISHNLPPAVKNSWGATSVTVEIKNTGAKPWVRRKAGLKFLSKDGASLFYDSADWIDREIASYSLEPNKAEIAPGDASIFKFTLKPKGLAPGEYYYRMSLYMKDKNELIYLNNGEFFEGVIRVDK